MSRPLLEVCVDSLAGVRAASEGGADRIELCSALDLGGLTPSMGLLREARAATDLPIFVMLRPRAGDFCFDDEEYRTLRADLGAFLQEDVQGVVTGVLDEQLSIDVVRTRELVELAGGLPLTFHRAFDLCPDASRALDALVACGVTRVLTSGGAGSASSGAERIRELVVRAGDDLVVVAGGGVAHDCLPGILEVTGVGEVHTSASGSRPRHGRPEPDTWSLAPTRPASAEGLRCTDATEVARCRRLLDAIE